MERTNRRTFMKQSTTAGFGLAAFSLSARRIYGAESGSFNRVVYRMLGSTGYKASEMGFGAMNMREPALVRAVIDSGINYIDTAHSYMNGANEEIIGTVMKTRRNEVFLTTKIKFDKDGVEIAKMPGMIETSLKRLQTDHVDLVLLHITDKREQVFRDDLMKVFENARDKGQTRFIGVSTHENQAEVLDAVVESKFWQAVLVGYNYYSPPEVTVAIQKAREAGIAIIGMKNLITIERPRKPFPDIRENKTGTTTNQQALLKWVLNNPYVDTVVPGMTSFEQLADDIAVMGKKLTYDDRRILKRYSEKAEGRYCCGVSGCTGCREQCPYGVNVSQINRCLNYAEGYGDIGLAYENYRSLPPDSRADKCEDCDECLVECVNGINLQENIRRARVMFG
ncbi:MAG: aldo/keto reductase [Candidatus Latescibacteria bacterium]|nr:aldo/keto reductase [Candidatus Latescibacterota bacterium]